MSSGIQKVLCGKNQGFDYQAPNGFKADLPIKCLVFSILLFFLCTAFPFSTHAVPDPNFVGGSGTEEDPWQIASQYELNQVRNFPDAHFVMIQDIEMYLLEEDENTTLLGWLPIESFRGTFDGGHKTITNLYMNHHSCPKTDFRRMLT